MKRRFPGDDDRYKRTIQLASVIGVVVPGTQQLKRQTIRERRRLLVRYEVSVVLLLIAVGGYKIDWCYYR